MVEYKNKTFVCYIDLGMELIRGKWKAVILCHLNTEPKRFLELQRITKGVSQKVLSQKLKELEEDGLIIKTVFPGLPLKVEYSLSGLGAELLPILKRLEVWAKHNF